MSYIVKNCPALKGWICYEQFIKQNKMVDCQDCTDCVMKQIYKTCKGQKESSCVFAVALLADRTLRLFDIEEINK